MNDGRRQRLQLQLNPAQCALLRNSKADDMAFGHEVAFFFSSGTGARISVWIHEAYLVADEFQAERDQLLFPVASVSLLRLQQPEPDAEEKVDPEEVKVTLLLKRTWHARRERGA